MLPVYFTVDVEVWCDGWTALDEGFAEAFKRYVYGPTRRGNFGLPAQLSLLRDHGLRAVFFVEPLFATRFGVQPLQELVGLIREHGQDVQLHLHTEWVDESPQPLLGEHGPRRKRQYLRQFSRVEQATLLALGRRMLIDAGAVEVVAFRAGGFGFNADTLSALADVGMQVDSSYNPTMLAGDSGVAPGQCLEDATRFGTVLELPMTVFDDGRGRLRHLQLGACSAAEFEACLDQAADQGRSAVVALSHNFELLSEDKRRVDEVVWRRMQRLCRYLDRGRGRFETRHFRGPLPAAATHKPSRLRTPRLATSRRVAEQALRRLLW
jgi:hypothetical protein